MVGKCAAWECIYRTQFGYCKLSACIDPKMWEKYNPPPSTSSGTNYSKNYISNKTNYKE